MHVMRNIPLSSRAADERHDVPLSFLAAYQTGVAILDQAGIPNASQEAMWLVEAGFGISRLTVFTDQDTPVSSEAWMDVLGKFCRRAAHEPLQYILGTQEFRGFSLNVAPGVFIPRPETELLVDEVLVHQKNGTPGLLADIGTGSGCLAIALASEIPHIQIFAVERNSTSMAMARRNAAQHLVQDRITFIEGDWVEPLYALGLVEELSYIVSNPPYIPSGQMASLPPTVRDFEPAMALDGGVEGLDFYARLLRDAPGLLQFGGRLVMEMGVGQADWVCHEAKQQGHFRICRIRHDNGGVARVVCLERIR